MCLFCKVVLFKVSNGFLIEAGSFRAPLSVYIYIYTHVLDTHFHLQGADRQTNEETDTQTDRRNRASVRTRSALCRLTPQKRANRQSWSNTVFDKNVDSMHAIRILDDVLDTMLS